MSIFTSPWFVGAVVFGAAGVCFEVFVHPLAGVVGGVGVLLGAVVGQWVGE